MSNYTITVTYLWYCPEYDTFARVYEFEGCAIINGKKIRTLFQKITVDASTEDFYGASEIDGAYFRRPLPSF